MDYEEKLALLDEEDFFTLFFKFQAEPRWVVSAGKRSIQIIGKCHHGDNHSALFDPTTLKVNCFSECGRGMQFHTWVKQSLDLDDPQDAKEFIESWIDNQEIDFSNRVSIKGFDFEYKERPYEREIIPPVKAIPKDKLKKYLDRFDNSLSILNNLVWHTEDGINPEILLLYGVYYYPGHQTIILPHHNINGDIIGLYERSFRELRKVIRKKYPDMPFKTDMLIKDKNGILKRQTQLIDYPRAKYVPLLRDEEDREEDKSSWSFPNSQNLYGFHLAKESIRKTKQAIIFEGGKSVMLAHQYGYENCVATHTFGAHVNHISMLIEAGAEEIILAFDKQYNDKDGQEWDLYEKKTKTLANKVGKEVKVSRIVDGIKNSDNSIIEYLSFKDSPIDKGLKVFELLLKNKEVLTGEEASKKIQTSIQEKSKRNLPELRLMFQKGFNENKLNENKKRYDLIDRKLLQILATELANKTNGEEVNSGN